MISRTESIASAAAFALLTSGSVFAQASPTVIVAFSGGSIGVPLDPWTSVAAALFIVVVAATIFRRRRAGRARWAANSGSRRLRPLQAPR